MAAKTQGAYSDTPLVKKLGVVNNSDGPREVALLGTLPEQFITWLGEVPANVSFRKSLTAKTALALYFVRNAKQLDALREDAGGEAAAGSVGVDHSPENTFEAGLW
jgi:hypothetical protein